MAFGPWWAFRAALVQADQHLPGVYELADAAGTIVFIGGTSDIKRRLLEHLHEDVHSCCRRHATQYRVDYRRDFAAEEQRLYDAFVLQHRVPPICNERRPSG